MQEVEQAQPLLTFHLELPSILLEKLTDGQANVLLPKEISTVLKAITNRDVAKGQQKGSHHIALGALVKLSTDVWGAARPTHPFLCLTQVQTAIRAKTRSRNPSTC